MPSHRFWGEFSPTTLVEKAFLQAKSMLPDASAYFQAKRNHLALRKIRSNTVSQAFWSWSMYGSEITRKLAELDQLLNDPELRIDPHRVWALVQGLKAPTKGVSATKARLFG